MKTQQAQDPVIGRVVKFLQVGKHPQKNEIFKEKLGTKQLLHEWQKLSLDPDGILQRRNGQYNQLVLPKKFHCQVVKELDEEMGHLGAERTVHLARQQFCWPHIQRDIENFVGNKC